MPGEFRGEEYFLDVTLACEDNLQVLGTKGGALLPQHLLVYFKSQQPQAQPPHSYNHFNHNTIFNHHKQHIHHNTAQ